MHLVVFSTCQNSNKRTYNFKPAQEITVLIAYVKTTLSNVYAEAIGESVSASIFCLCKY